MAIVFSYKSPCAIIQDIVETELSSASVLASANFYLFEGWALIAYVHTTPYCASDPKYGNRTSAAWIRSAILADESFMTASRNTFGSVK
jgi:hypothetical protein